MTTDLRLAATVLLGSLALATVELTAQTPPAATPPAAPAGQAPAGGRRGGGPPVPPITPSPSRVMAPGAVVEKIPGEFMFTEGPTTDAVGNVYFSDQPNNRILKYDTAGVLTTFLEPAGRTNGMTFDNAGHIIAAADEKNEMWSIDVATKRTTVLFATYEGKPLNGPNDIWVHPTTGRISLTDPFYARNYWNRGPRENVETVYVYSPADKSLKRLDDDLGQANGIIGTPDGRTLYVADIRNRQTFAYDIAADGTLANKRLFCE